MSKNNSVQSPQGVEAQNLEFEAAISYDKASECCPTFPELVEKWKKAREAGKLSDAFLMWFFMGIRLENEGFRYRLFNQVFDLLSVELAAAMLMWRYERDYKFHFKKGEEFNEAYVKSYTQLLMSEDTFWGNFDAEFLIKIEEAVQKGFFWNQYIANLLLQMEGKFSIYSILKEMEDHHPLVAKALKEAAGENFLNKYYFFDRVNRTWCLRVRPGQGFRP